MSSSATFSAVVCGAGGISNAWFPPLKAEDVRVLAVVDLRLENAQAQIAKYGLKDCEAATNLTAMLKKYRPDFVLDLTIPEAHGAVTCAALRAGCHVIGEKPMAATLAEARKMVRAAEQTGRLYMVSQSRRWEPRHYTIRDTVAAGRLGTLTTLNCDFYIGAHFGGFRDQMHSPLILDMAIHHFDLARFFGAGTPVAVYAHEFNPHGSWYKGAAAATCIFEMSGGAIFTYRGSWCAEGCPTSWHGDWRLIGDRGTLIYEKDQEPRGQLLAGPEEGFNRPLKELEITPSQPPQTGMHGALLEMLAFLRTGQKPQTECHDNIQSLAMVFAAIHSAKLKRRIRIPTA